MKVLLAHNFYRSSAPSGEDRVFRAEETLLRAEGVDVLTFEKHNDDIDANGMWRRTKLGIATGWSRKTYKEILNLLTMSRPDVVHFHNTFPLISPSAYWACKRVGIPVVQTLHNYRLICAGAMLVRDGKPCEDCVGKTLLPALRHRCYRGSLSATAAVVMMLMRNRVRGTYSTAVDRYIALTRFAASKLSAGGVPRPKIDIKPNFVFDAGVSNVHSGRSAIFVGRLSTEKGVTTMLRAWEILKSTPLKVLGDGPMRGMMEEYVRTKHMPIEIVGLCNRERVIDELKKAAFLVMPSESYEGFPTVVLEAYSVGLPIVASDIGSLSEIVAEGESGLKFKAGQPSDLADKVRVMLADSDRLVKMRQNARAIYESQYTPKVNFHKLMAIYKKAIDANSSAVTTPNSDE